MNRLRNAYQLVLAAAGAWADGFIEGDRAALGEEDGPSPFYVAALALAVQKATGWRRYFYEGRLVAATAAVSRKVGS